MLTLKVKQFASAAIVILTGYYFVCSIRSEITVVNATGLPISNIFYRNECLAYRKVSIIGPGKSAKLDPEGGLRDTSYVHYTDELGKEHGIPVKSAKTAWPFPQQITLTVLPDGRCSWYSSRFVANHLVRSNDFSNDVCP